MLETNPMNNRDTLFCGSEPLLDVWIAFEFHKMGIWFLELAEWILGVKYYRVSHMDHGIKFERRGHIIFFFVNFNYYNFIYNDYFKSMGWVCFIIFSYLCTGLLWFLIVAPSRVIRAIIQLFFEYKSNFFYKSILVKY